MKRKKKQIPIEQVIIILMIVFNQIDYFIWDTIPDIKIMIVEVLKKLAK